MPLSVNIPSDIQPGTSYDAWVWGPRLRIDAENQNITVEYVAYASAEAAYAGGKPIGKPYSRYLSGAEFRDFVRDHQDLWTSLVHTIDEAAAGVPALAGATILEGQELPAWINDVEA